MSVLTTPSVLYNARLLALAQASGPPRERYNLPQGCPIQFAAYAFDQEFEMQLWNPTTGVKLFPPAQKNTPSNATSGGNAVFAGLADGNAILTKLSQPSPTGGGKGKFTGSFCVVPASWDEFPKQTVTFPGIRDINYTGGTRDPQPKNVKVRVRHDYFVLDPAAALTGAGVNDSGGTPIKLVSNVGAIPDLYRTPWKFLVSSAILATSEVTGLVKAGGITGWLETVPNTETYQAWVVVATAFNNALVAGGTQAWDATHPPLWNGAIGPATTLGQFCFQDSGLATYEGNIFDRTSFFVLAQ